MNILQLFLIVSGIVISIIAFDIAKKQKFNAIHFLIFISIWVWLLIFTFFPSILKFIWDFFWVPKWSDVLVYVSIIFLIYFSLLLLNKIESNNHDLTHLIREISIKNWPRKSIKWRELFIIPSYNEAEVICDTIDEIFLNGYENILIINDWSTDNTNTKIKNKFWDRVILLEHYKNRGQGASLETGFEYARRYAEVEYVITYDADGQHDINDVKEFEKYLNHHHKVDILLWSRFLWKKQRWIPFIRKIILKLWILFTFVMSNINLSDTHNWFRAIKLDALDKIRLTIDWMWHASEVIDIISSKKLLFKEVPVNIKYTEYSMKKWQSSLKAFKIALKVIWNKFFK